jgi:acyl-CoA synthetase (AMP-forming)/AMP-acid ligase II
LAKCIATKRITTYHILRDQALRNRPDHTFLIFEDRAYTYGQFFQCVTRVGNWLLQELDVQKGDIVALDGGNCPEYLMLWFALEGIGAVPSFVNNNLTSQSLLHCIQVRNYLLKSDPLLFTALI